MAVRRSLPRPATPCWRRQVGERWRGPAANAACGCSACQRRTSRPHPQRLRSPRAQRWIGPAVQPPRLRLRLRQRAARVDHGGAAPAEVPARIGPQQLRVDGLLWPGPALRQPWRQLRIQPCPRAPCGMSLGVRRRAPGARQRVGRVGLVWPVGLVGPIRDLNDRTSRQRARRPLPLAAMPPRRPRGAGRSAPGLGSAAHQPAVVRRVGAVRAWTAVVRLPAMPVRAHQQSTACGRRGCAARCGRACGGAAVALRWRCGPDPGHRTAPAPPQSHAACLRCGPAVPQQTRCARGS